MRAPIVLGVAVLGLAIAGSPAWAASKARITLCRNASRQADELIKDGHLLAARSWLHTCAQPSCSLVIRRQCMIRLSQLAEDTPSIIPIATGESGQPVTDVEVTLDGQALTTRTDGRAVPVDPGEHELSFKAADGKVLTQKTVVVQGQRNRLVEVSFRSPERRPPGTAVPAPRVVAEEERPAPPRVAPPPRRMERRLDEPGPRLRESSGHPVAPYVLGGLGAASLTAFGLLTYWGRQDDQLLVRNCSPDCKPESIDHIRNLYLGAKISLGVGLAALGAAAIVAISNGSSGEREIASSKPRSYELELRPTTSGAVAAVSGSF